MGPILGTSPISKEISRSGGKPSNSSEKTSIKFHTIGTLDGSTFFSFVLSTVEARKHIHPFESIFCACIAEINILWLSRDLPLKENFSPSLGLKVTLQCLQSMMALHFPRKSIPKMTSKSFISIAIRSVLSVMPFIDIRTCLRKNSDTRISPEGKLSLKILGVYQFHY